MRRTFGGSLMSLIGHRLGPYEIVALLGKGGMGEVYRARDARLGRDVAIKGLPADLATAPDRLARFRREARTLAALNHPNIASIYGLEESGGTSFLVLELVEGDTLAERIARAGPLPVADAVHIGIQVARALEEAHDKGIVHRDVKPANIKVTADGRVKVLDFGLARSDPAAPALDDASVLTTLATRTEPGAIVGTPPYMSPEQVRGEPLTWQTDVWGIGCVLFELLSGTRAFHRTTVPDTLAGVLQGHPDWRALPPAVPDILRRLIERCLDKDLARRIPSMAGVREELERAGIGATAPTRARVGGLVVLPLRNLSGDPAQEFFADGMTEALIWDLAKVRALRVISRTSAMRYKASDKTLQEIARELKIDAVLEGSVARAGERVLIRAQLVEAATDTTLWNQSYDRDVRDVLILQTEIARAIANEIQVAVTPEERRQLDEGARTVDPVAYEAYLKGQFHWGKLTPPDLDAALGYFERAREREPALGYVGIAAVWAARQQMNLAPPTVASPRAREAMRRALDAGPALPEVQYINALVSWCADWDWPATRAAFDRTFQLRSSFPDARAYHAHFLTIENRPLEAIAEMQRAIDLDPHNALFRALFGIVLLYARDYDRAVAEVRAIQSLVPLNPVITRCLTGAFHMLGRYAEARAEHRAWFAAVGDTEVVAALDAGRSYQAALGGAADVLAARERPTSYSTFEVMALFTCAGRTDDALHWLELAFERRDPDMPYMRNPITDVLSGEPRYRAVLAKMRLPAA
jgi:TolB-like protein